MIPVQKRLFYYVNQCESEACSRITLDIPKHINDPDSRKKLQMYL